MRLLKVGIRLVERVLEAVALERDALRRERSGNIGVAHPARADPVLVDVVAEVDDEVEVLLRHSAVRRVEPVVPLLAGRERERQLAHAVVRPGRRLGPSHRALVPVGQEAVEVLAAGRRPFTSTWTEWPSSGTAAARAGLLDVPEARVRRDLPAHADVLRRHAATLHQRLRREARPQRHTVGRGIARSDAEAERIGLQARSCEREVAAELGVGAVPASAPVKARNRRRSMTQSPSSASVRRGSDISPPVSLGVPRSALYITVRSLARDGRRTLAHPGP